MLAADSASVGPVSELKENANQGNLDYTGNLEFFTKILIRKSTSMNRVVDGTNKSN
jgi:hypothetical protein